MRHFRPSSPYFWIGCLLALAVGWWLRLSLTPEWHPLANGPQAGRPWAVEADCYSQLARVDRILHGNGLIQNHFKVENWPEGLTPSTTAPFDYVILVLWALLAPFTRYPLDWAGALVSPLLWTGLVALALFYRSGQFTRFGRFLFVAGSALLHPIIWATAMGRSRHQSLILFLMTLGLAAEYERWAATDEVRRRRWNLGAGAIWGLACWTSLFEPLAAVIFLVLFNLAARRCEDRRFLLGFGVVMLAALLLEGPHLYIPPPEYHAALVHWLATIAEIQPLGSLQPLEMEAFFIQLSLGVILLPFVGWRLCRGGGYGKTDAALVLLTLVLMLFAFFQQRWVYYAALDELLMIVRYVQLRPDRWTRWIVLAIFGTGLAWSARDQLTRPQPPPNQPSPQLAQIGHAIDASGGILAPWWLSPGLLYFSGQPIVSGSSHCGISGIVASAEFYTATSWTRAKEVLQRRQVRWVVVFDDPQFLYPTLNSSYGILGLPPVTDEAPGQSESTMAQILIQDRFVPDELRLRAVTPQLKLYEFAPR